MPSKLQNFKLSILTTDDKEWSPILPLFGTRPLFFRNLLSKLK
jgi:hypothetical protein